MTVAELSLVLALASAVTTTDYPERAVWESFVAFCESAKPEGWSEFIPQPDTTLAYLAEDRTPRIDLSKGDSAIVYQSTVAGRTVYAMKLPVSDSEFCQVYDFNASDRLNRSDWERIVGKFSSVDEREYTQQFRFGVSDKPLGLNGTITHHHRDYFPIPDTIGFIGLQLSTISKEGS